VSVVEIEANLGILRKLLFSIIKLSLEKIANNIAAINFQLNNNPIIPFQLNKLPEIKFRSPTNTIETEEETQ